MSIVPEILHKAADLFEERNAIYKSGYKDHASMLFQMIGPVQIESVNDMERILRVSACVGKLTRYAKNIKEGHPDSARDLVVYAAMLQELDEL